MKFFITSLDSGNKTRIVSLRNNSFVLSSTLERRPIRHPGIYCIYTMLGYFHVKIENRYWDDHQLMLSDQPKMCIGMTVEKYAYPFLINGKSGKVPKGSLLTEEIVKIGDLIWFNRYIPPSGDKEWDKWLSTHRWKKIC